MKDRIPDEVCRFLCIFVQVMCVFLLIAIFSLSVQREAKEAKLELEQLNQSTDVVPMGSP